MSPPVITPQPAFEFAKPDSAQSSESGENFNFSSASADAARFDYSKSGTEKSRISGRSRPRLMKMRRRQMPDGKTVRTDLGLNGFSDGGGEKHFEGKLGNVFGINNGNLGSNGGEEKGRVVNENVDIGNGFDFNVELANFLSGFESGKITPVSDATEGTMPSKRQSKRCDFSFDFDIRSSNSMQKETGSFVFGASKGAPVSNPAEADLGREQFVFRVGGTVDSRDSSFSMKDSSDSASQVKLEQQGLHNSGLNSSADEFVNFNAVDFKFGASKTDEVVGSTIHDIRGKVKLDGTGATEKVSDPGFKCSFNSRDGSGNHRENFVFTSHNIDFKFDIGMENKSAGRKGDVPNFTKSEKENA